MVTGQPMMVAPSFFTSFYERNKYLAGDPDEKEACYPL